MAKVRFIFRREMTEDQMVDAITLMAKEHGLKVIGDSKKPRERKSSRNKVKKLRT
jgi:hypothetical protein